MAEDAPEQTAVYAPVIDSQAAMAAGPMAPTITDLVRHGGRVQHAPRVFISYWGWPATLSAAQTNYRNEINSFVGNIGGTSMLAVETQYTDATGAIGNGARLGGTWGDTTAAPATMTATDVYNAAVRARNHFGASADANYMIVTPAGHTQTGFGTQWCGYHTVSTNDLNMSYTLIPWQTGVAGCAAYDLTGIIQHEMMETESDPTMTCPTSGCYMTGWYQGANTASPGTENADLCVNNPNQPFTESRLVGGITRTVHAVMSNTDNQCVFFLLPPAAASITSSASSTLHSATARCDFDRYSDPYNYGDGGEGTVQAAKSDALPVISSSVTCTVSTTDASAPLKTRSWSASGGANTSSVSLYNFGLPFSARGTNKVCVSGSFVYADSTLTIPTRCTTF